MKRLIEDLTYFYREMNVYGILVGYFGLPVLFTLFFLCMVFVGLIPLTLKQSGQYWFLSLLLIMVPELLLSIWNAENEIRKIKLYREGINTVNLSKAIKNYVKIIIEKNEIKIFSIFVYQLLAIILLSWNILFNSEANMLNLSLMFFYPLFALFLFNLVLFLGYCAGVNYEMSGDLKEFSKMLVEEKKIADDNLINFIENYDILSEQKKLKDDITVNETSSGNQSPFIRI